MKKIKEEKLEELYFPMTLTALDQMLKKEEVFVLLNKVEVRVLLRQYLEFKKAPYYAEVVYSKDQL